MAGSKVELREASLARRSMVPEESRAAFARRLVQVGARLVDGAPAGRATRVALYSAIGSEPDTSLLAEALHAADVTLALPVTGPAGTPLVFRRWSPGEATVPGRMNIGEPPATAAAVDPDLLFVPLVAFDRRGHRIGYGAGHYDRTLAALRARKAIQAIGIAYGVQEVLFIPADDHDQPLDLIVTDRETLVCGL